MSESEKVNGDITADNTAKSPQTTQRKPRLNRRGLHLLNNPLVNLCSDSSVQQNSDVNGNNEGSENKSKTDSSQKRVISLISIKSPSSSSSSSSEKISLKRKETTTITLKKSSCNTSKGESTENTGISSSSEPPPKKKHKPITWP